MELIFATNNQNKVGEVKRILKSQFEILSLSDIGFTGDIDETEPTIKGNSELKADFIFKKYNKNCFADDTGMEVESLNGAPGVHSARYAGDDCVYSENVEKILRELRGVKNRKAKFITVITLILDGKKYFFEAITFGKIINETRGSLGFGYDPIFLPDGYNQTYAEMTHELKNKISHRGIAIQKLTDFLTKQE